MSTPVLPPIDLSQLPFVTGANKKKKIPPPTPETWVHRLSHKLDAAISRPRMRGDLQYKKPRRGTDDPKYSRRFSTIGEGHDQKRPCSAALLRTDTVFIDTVSQSYRAGDSGELLFPFIHHTSRFIDGVHDRDVQILRNLLAGPIEKGTFLRLDSKSYFPLTLFRKQHKGVSADHVLTALFSSSDYLPDSCFGSYAKKASSRDAVKLFHDATKGGEGLQAEIHETLKGYKEVFKGLLWARCCLGCEGEQGQRALLPPFSQILTDNIHERVQGLKPGESCLFPGMWNLVDCPEYLLDYEVRCSGEGFYSFTLHDIEGPMTFHDVPGEVMLQRTFYEQLVHWSLGQERLKFRANVNKTEYFEKFLRVDLRPGRTWRGPEMRRTIVGNKAFANMIHFLKGQFKDEDGKRDTRAFDFFLYRVRTDYLADHLRASGVSWSRSEERKKIANGALSYYYWREQALINRYGISLFTSKKPVKREVIKDHDHQLFGFRFPSFGGKREGHHDMSCRIVLGKAGNVTVR